MAMNQKELRTRATTTPAPMLTRVITKGTTNGKAIAPARGVMATNQRMIKKS